MSPSHRMQENHPMVMADYFRPYVQRVPTGVDILTVLENNRDTLTDYYEALDDAAWDYAYAPGKWTARAVLLHLIDAERVFSYRALRIGRGDDTPLPGFDHNAYVPASQADQRSATSLLVEYRVVRAATLALYEGLPASAWNQIGTASGNPLSTRALAYMTAGHELHHLAILQERYFPDPPSA